MYTIHQIETNYFVSRPKYPNYLAELVVPGNLNEMSYKEGFTRIYESACHLIYLESSNNAVYYKAENVFTNWAEFPQLHNKEVFAICENTEQGDQYIVEAEILGIELEEPRYPVFLEAINNAQKNRA